MLSNITFTNFKSEEHSSLQKVANTHKVFLFYLFIHLFNMDITITLDEPDALFKV